MAITAYMVVTNDTARRFGESVNNAIKDGWQPFGAPMKDGGCYAQAMVQHTPEYRGSSMLTAFNCYPD